jgi:hypothetical protein
MVTGPGVWSVSPPSSAQRARARAAAIRGSKLFPFPVIREHAVTDALGESARGNNPQPTKRRTVQLPTLRYAIILPYSAMIT